MFPETPFHKFGKQNLMFAVVDNQIYHTSNASTPKEDYLSLCGLFFPLEKSETIENLEKRYIEKNTSELEKFKREYAESIKGENNYLEDINKEIEQNKNLFFFLSEVVPIYIGEKILSKKTIEKKQEESILERILGENVVIINKRVYAINEINNPSVITISGKNYCLGKSDKTIDKIEEKFMDSLKEQLKKNVLDKIEYSKEIKEKIINMDIRIRDIALKKHIVKTNNSFEYGDLGYDTHLQRIYCILQPHYNKTTSTKYKEKQGAIGVSIDNNQSLKTDQVILFREKVDSDFIIHRTSLCLGMSPRGNTTKDIVVYLLNAAENIRYNGACHE